MLGKKLYKTGMLNIFRMVIFAIVIFFLNDFILDTYTYEKFQALRRFKILDILEYHYRYPHEFITFFILIIGPAVYYSLIRGVRFHERGFIFNRGLPFMNKTILYDEIKKFKLLHPNNVVTIHSKTGEIFLVADNSIERVVAILDQHNIQGDLARDDYSNVITNFRKIIILFLAFTSIVFIAKKLGLFFR
jgi:hypothetical protein